MYLPLAFIDGVRELAMSDALTFSLLGPAILARHPRAAELAAPGALLRGWAELADRTIEEAGVRSLLVEDDRRELFEGARVHAAVAQVAAALGELGDGDLSALDLQGETPAATLEAARRFVAHAAKIAAKLGEVRAPSFRALWTGAGSEPAPFAKLPFALNSGDARDGVVLVADGGATRLELRRAGVPIQIVEVEPAARSGRVLRLAHFSPPDGLTDGDREVALYDWIDEQVEALAAAANPPAPTFDLSCSFCGKSQSEVKKIIAGPTSYICNECVAMCQEIIGEEAAATGQ